MSKNDDVKYSQPMLYVVIENGCLRSVFIRPESHMSEHVYLPDLDIEVLDMDDNCQCEPTECDIAKLKARVLEMENYSDPNTAEQKYVRLR